MSTFLIKAAISQSSSYPIVMRNACKNYDILLYLVFCIMYLVILIYQERLSYNATCCALDTSIQYTSTIVFKIVLLE